MVTVVGINQLVDRQIVIKSCRLHDFWPTSDIFKNLQNESTALSFCNNVKRLMGDYGLQFHTADGPNTSTPVPQKGDYKCPYDFQDQVVILRDLHPEKV